MQSAGWILGTASATGLQISSQAFEFFESLEIFPVLLASKTYHFPFKKHRG